MKARVKYRRIRVTVEVPKNFRKKCDACGKTGKIDLHHLIYQFPTKEVRKNPQLALKNTVCLCYKHHRIADLIRKLIETDGVELGKVMRVIGDFV